VFPEAFSKPGNIDKFRTTTVAGPERYEKENRVYIPRATQTDKKTAGEFLVPDWSDHVRVDLPVVCHAE
jgi:hypothetical protein